MKILCAGEQEKQALNLEKIHAAAVRQEPPSSSTGREPKSNGAAELVISGEVGEPMVGPVLPRDGGEDEAEDPYNLPVSHEVVVEGAILTKAIFAALLLHSLSIEFSVPSWLDLVFQMCPFQQA